jgi:hypothetical protein
MSILFSSVLAAIFEMYCTVGMLLKCARGEAPQEEKKTHTTLMISAKDRGDDEIEEPTTTSTIQFIFFVIDLATLSVFRLCTGDGE